MGDLNRIVEHVAVRLHRAVGQVYEVPPAGSPIVPCCIIEWPTIDDFHSEFSHHVCNYGFRVRLLVGRGDAADATRMLYSLMSNSNEGSVPRALEYDDSTEDERPWARLTVVSTDPIRDDGDTIGVTFNISIDA